MTGVTVVTYFRASDQTPLAQLRKFGYGEAFKRSIGRLVSPPAEERQKNLIVVLRGVNGV